jgi:hypothetical protein
MKKYGIAARRKKKRYVYPGKASSIAPNLLQNATQKALFIHGRDEWVFLLWWIEWGERDEG